VTKNGRDDRDAGIDKVARAKWQHDASIYILRYIPKNWEGPFEEVRLTLLVKGCKPPHHHNAWGALCMKLTKGGWFEFTGRYQQARMRPTHAHAVKVLRKLV
jgi:hypothetical protein